MRSAQPMYFAATDVADWLDEREQPGKSGFYPLNNGLEAFGARLALIDEADRSIDAQYFLMKPDSAGLVFAGKLLAAADRSPRRPFFCLNRKAGKNGKT